MKTKTFQSPITVKAGAKGEFRAVFSKFNVVDHDNDVTLPGAFKDGEKVRIAYWGHRWQDLPVGRGVIHQDQEKAWVDGQFFLDTEAGSETYKTVLALGELQEWSYGFDILEAEPGKFQGQSVQFLKRLKVFEVSPVMLAAGIGTHTESIKSQNAGNKSSAELINEIDRLQFGGVWLPIGSRSTASIRKELEDLATTEQLINGIDDIELDLKILETENRVSQIMGEDRPVSRLEVYRQSLIDDGYSPALADVNCQIAIDNLARELRAANPQLAHMPDDYFQARAAELLR